MSAEDNRAIDIMHDVATFVGKLAVSDYTLAGWICVINLAPTNALHYSQLYTSTKKQ